MPIKKNTFHPVQFSKVGSGESKQAEVKKELRYHVSSHPLGSAALPSTTLKLIFNPTPPFFSFLHEKHLNFVLFLLS